MPKSRRDRPVTLSTTRKKGRDLKEFLVSAIRDALDSYGSVYVFSFENMRNLKFKELGEQLKSSSRLFNEFEQYDFARTGSKATEKVELLKEGPLTEFTHEMEPFLRKQGIPVCLNKATIGHKDGYLQNALDLPMERRRLRAPCRGVR